MTDTKMTYFTAEYTLLVGAIVASDQDETAARDLMIQNLTMSYGPDTAKLVTFRVATEEEIAEYEAARLEQGIPDTATLN